MLLINVMFYAAVFLAFAGVYVLSDRNNTGFYLFTAISLIFYYIFINPITVATALAIWPTALLIGFFYVAIGVVWSFYQWYRYTHNRLMIDNQKQAFERLKKQSRNADTDLEDLKNEFIQSQDNILNYRNNRNIFRIHKWVIYWPFSVLGAIFGNILYDGMVYLIKSFGKIYDHISGNGKNLS